MAYIGREPTNSGQFLIIDDISSNFNSSNTSFNLTIGGNAINPAKENIIIALDGVLQQSNESYAVTGSTISFTEAPGPSVSFYGLLTGESQFIANESISNDKISPTANISGSKINTDFSGQTVQAKIFSGMVSSSAQIATDISGSLSNTAIGALDAGIVSGSAQLADDISGSFSQAHLSSKISGIVSASVLSSPSQGTIRLATNGVNTDVDSGLQTGDSPTFAGGTITGDFAVGGTLTAQEVHTEFESASILFTSGSTQFGNSSDDVHEFRGNVISGSSTSTASLAMISLADKIEHIGDTNNTIEFGTDEIKLRTGGGSRLIARDSNVELYNDLIVANQTFIGGSADEGYSLLLNIEGAGGTDDVPGILFKNTSASNDEEIMSLLGTQGSDSVAAINIKREANADDAYIDFMTQANGGSMTERMRIDSDGFVGINNNNPSAHLDVGGGAVIGGDAIIGRTGNQKGKLTIQSRTGTATRKTNAIVAVPYNDTSESICMIGMDGQSSNNEMHIGSNTGDFMSPTFIDFFTASDINSQTNNRVMRMDSAGRVGINTNNPTETLFVNGVILSTSGYISQHDTSYYRLSSANGTERARFILDGSDLQVKMGGSEKVRIDSSGKVGIGTSAPTSDFGFTPLLHVRKDGDIAGIIIDNATEKFEFVMNDNSDYLRLAAGSENSILSIENTGEIYCGIRQLTLQKNTSHRFNVQAPVGTGSFISAFANNSSPAINLYRTNSTTIGSFTSGNTADSDVIGAINFYGSSNSAHRIGAAIDVRQDGTDDCEPNTPTRMDIYVSGGTNISFPLMSLDGPANCVGIGNKTPAVKLDVDSHGSSDIMRLSNDSNSNGFIFGYTTNLGSIDLQASQAMRIRQGSSVPLLINTNGVIDGNFNNTSDKALKKDIKDLGKTLESVNKIKPSTFKWKEETKGDDKQIGFIAQDVEKYFPELVHGEEGTKSINTLGVVSVLMKAVQELSTKVTKLEAQISGSN